MKSDATGRSACSLRVRELIEEYLADREAEGQNTTRARQQLDAHVLPAWGERAFSELTARELKAWRNTLVATPPRVRRSRGARVPRYRDVDLSNPEVARRRRATANRILTTFKAALNHAACLHPDASPDPDVWQQGLKAFRRVGAPRERWLTADEAVALLEHCRDDFRPLVRAALYTGCRYGELCRARVQDFDTARGTLRVPMSKSGGWRDVVLHAEAARFFRELIAGRPPAQPLFLRDGRRSRSREPGESDAAGTRRAWRRGDQVRPIAEACREAGINPPISFHGLRHTYASLAVQSGMALIALARNLGHADTRMVEKHYGHLSDRYMRAQVDRHAPRLDGRRRPW